jgi:inosose dehydratase
MTLTIGTGEYAWTQYYGFKGRNLADHLDEALASAAQAGVRAWEPTAPDEASAARIGPLLRKHALSMPSAYMNARLHAADWPKVADEVVRRARVSHPLGLRVMVINPEPIDWNDKSSDKSDAELRVQATAMRHLAGALREVGVALAYHTHDMEMRQAAREFHHMLIATRDVGMGLCLDNHWIYRGAGNSQVALDDVLDLYGDRIISLHLRQSRGGVWTETLCDGDVDFRPIAATLKRIGFDGPIIIEQAYEQGTPRDLSMAESHRISREWVQRTLGT